MLRQLPPADRAVYQQCESAAKAPVEMARCVVKALDLRDQVKYREAASSVGRPPEAAYSDDERILTKLVQMIWPKSDDRSSRPIVGSATSTTDSPITTRNIITVGSAH